MCVCVCVCVCARARVLIVFIVCVCVCVCVCARAHVRALIVFLPNGRTIGLMPWQPLRLFLSYLSKYITSLNEVLSF